MNSAYGFLEQVYGMNLSASSQPTQQDITQEELEKMCKGTNRTKITPHMKAAFAMADKRISHLTLDARKSNENE